MIPQLKNTLGNVLIILVAVPMASCVFLYRIGELHGWADMAKAINHSGFNAVIAAMGWILMKSPFAGKITQLLQTSTKETGSQTTTSTTKLTISEPAQAQPPEAK